MQGMFSAKNGSVMQVVKIHGIENLDVSNVENLYYMFSYCTNLKGLDLSKWDISNCTTIKQICYQCAELEHVFGTEKWDMSNVVNMYGAFYNCKKLKELNLTGWTTSGGVNKEGMLSGTDCLEKITVSKEFDFSGTGIPNPSATHIEGADGKWHTIHRDSFTSDALPSGINVTYYATEAAAQEDLAKLKQTFVLVDGHTAVGVADAIREKTGTYGDLTPSEWAAKIKTI
jgi:surface protein